MRGAFWTRLGVAACGLAVTAAVAAAGAVVPVVKADLVVTGGRIYTAADGGLAEALAVSAGRILYVGTEVGARDFVGPQTRVEALHGAFVVPGLVDAHLHPIDTVDLQVCDLDSKVVSLRQLSAFVKICLRKYPVAPGKRLLVHQWNYTTGNQPDPDYPTLRVALDKASTTRQLQLLGNDAHHGAFNSLALASARNAKGAIVGISRDTLRSDFAAYATLIGVDATGVPNGAVNEDARYTINPRSMMLQELELVLKAPSAITRRMNSIGITAMTDAMADPAGYAVWDSLQKSGQLTVRTTLAQFYDPAQFHRADGAVDYDEMVRRAEVVRAKYQGNPLIRADMVKIFADGVLEGNPFAVPPTLPNGAVLAPLLQPMFATDKDGHATVTGYVDTGSELCASVRSDSARYAQDAEVVAFSKAHGFHPAQCAVSNGQLQHERNVILEFARRFHLAGFNLHIHVIGDRAVRTAVDAIEAARAADGVSSTRDGLAHVQLAHPDDIARIGRDHLYIAYTYAWANVDVDYDMTVLPFLQKVSGNGYEQLHPQGGYYESNSYPVRATRDAGAILAAGSDAPVETRDPRPFVNMSVALTRHHPGQPAMNAEQTIGINDVLRAYTINGARWQGIDREAGSLEVGKSADFVVLDRDLLRLAESGHADDIAGTRVRSTRFMGKRVYKAAH
ncbi:MAG: amidohydrolase family protein [Proteobacteria bacterium]|nr:amidohydrolase family protein [Pseudomonadota bacterium]